MRQKRRKFSSTFKTKVVMEALKERETLSQLAQRFEIHPNQISQWKREFTSNAELAFKGHSASVEPEVNSDRLYRRIGELEMENDFLKKSLNKIGL